MSLTQDLLQELFEYRDGSLYNKLTRAPNQTKGKVAGSLNPSNGYMRVKIKGRTYQLSRIIWTYHNGDIPEGMQIDHIDRDPLNNRIENLRVVDQAQNEWNKPFENVNFEKGRWRARIQCRGKDHYIGLFVDKQDALSAAQKAKTEIRGAV